MEDYEVLEGGQTSTTFRARQLTGSLKYLLFQKVKRLTKPKIWYEVSTKIKQSVLGSVRVSANYICTLQFTTSRGLKRARNQAQ
jgi:hypothetical protein